MSDRVGGEREGRRIFVYGTLLPGERNHLELLGARHEGAARTQPGWELVDLGPFPGMRAGEGVVEGAVFVVDDAHLAKLDAFEGDLFVRRPIALVEGEAEAWILATDREGTPIPSGRYADRPRIAD
ncbi:MAG: gamma-glutamylcyclotransferase family protein [Polyangiales bacterium]